jgi:NAC domain
MDDKQARIAAARAKLAAKYKNEDGSMKVVKKNRPSAKNTGPTNSKLQGIMKKVGADVIPEIAEVNFFTDSGKVWRFITPAGNQFY